MEVTAGLEPAKTGFADQRLGLFGIATKLFRERPTRAQNAPKERFLTPRTSFGMTGHLPLEPMGVARIALTRMLATPVFNQNLNQVLRNRHDVTTKTKNPSARCSGDGFEIDRNG
jgi:hypothetical protein